MEIKEKGITDFLEKSSLALRYAALGLAAYFAYRTLSKYGPEISGFLEHVQLEAVDALTEYRMKKS